MLSKKEMVLNMSLNGPLIYPILHLDRIFNRSKVSGRIRGTSPKNQNNKTINVLCFKKAWKIFVTEVIIPPIRVAFSLSLLTALKKKFLLSNKESNLYSKRKVQESNMKTKALWQSQRVLRNKFTMREILIHLMWTQNKTVWNRTIRH